VREARRRREKVLQADRRGMPLYKLLFWEKVVENQRRGGVCFRFLVTTSIGKGTKQNPKERKKTPPVMQQQRMLLPDLLRN
jgi:hypothetical protein